MTARITVPEVPEVDTDRLHEQIQEDLEHDAGASLKAIALTTALFCGISGNRCSARSRHRERGARIENRGDTPSG